MPTEYWRLTERLFILFKTVNWVFYSIIFIWETTTLASHPGYSPVASFGLDLNISLFNCVRYSRWTSHHQQSALMWLMRFDRFQQNSQPDYISKTTKNPETSPKALDIGKGRHILRFSDFAWETRSLWCPCITSTWMFSTNFPSPSVCKVSYNRNGSGYHRHTVCADILFVKINHC